MDMKLCKRCGKHLALSDPDLCELCDLHSALPDPDKLLWVAEWLDRADAVVTAYVEHHDMLCASREFEQEGCGELGPGEKRDRLLEFMDHKTQDDLRTAARRIKEVQARG